jgi:CRISPR-associated endonuclease Csn1
MNAWVCEGFYTDSRLRLRPRGLAGEGLPEESPAGVRLVLAGRGWLPSVDIVFGTCKAAVIRRDILGRPRLESTKGLPTCWSSSVVPFLRRGKDG